jgi:hypothetical protein
MVKTNNMKQYKAIPNYSKRTFTIRTINAKYRTLAMSKTEFNDSLYNTSSDWVNYIKTNQVIIIK